MTKKINNILDYFSELFPHAGCELKYHNDYQLAIAVMLSAQTTDKKVNTVTEKLFSIYPNLISLSNASPNDVQNVIKTLGMSKNKARYTVEIAKRISEEFNGIVPSDREVLMSLPGVGNKTANVIRAELFKIPELPIDTHVMRVSKRLGLVSNSDNPIQIEKKLKKIIPLERQILTHHQMINLGRYFYKPRSPKCEQYKLKEVCLYQLKKIK
ncbi:MAG: endonuclease III [Erysipelotrichia bacterium]|nr:endonuclease III [Erysipelotrichia bacterium]